MDTAGFGLVVLVTAVAGAAAVLSSRVSERLRIPAPALFLIAASAAVDIWPSLGRLSFTAVEHTVTLALAVILFNGGAHMGWPRLRSAAAPVLWTGVVGTLLTAAAVAVVARLAIGLDWRAALLLGAALAPTDPAVVFSILGRREITGRAGTLLEGESGANDPVGIALLVALLAEPVLGAAAAAHVVWELAAQLAVGTAVGAAGGWALLAFMRRVRLPDEGLYPLRVLAGALAIYGLATVAHGSGFLAVFVAGVVVGGQRAPFQRDIARFHATLASLAEIVAFTMLGLTIRLHSLAEDWAWLTGLVLAAALALVIRPVLTGALLWRLRLPRGERLLVAWAGLKGAVPILLGVFIVQSGVPQGRKLYEIIFVVVAFSVIVQGGTLPALLRRFQVPLRAVEPEPWSLGIRLRHEPEGLHRFAVAADSAADGARVGGLLAAGVGWVSLVIRRGRLVPVNADTVLQGGDEAVVMLSGGHDASRLAPLFAEPGARLREIPVVVRRLQDD
jgi:potassium/hydrogen antiporter